VYFSIIFLLIALSRRITGGSQVTSMMVEALSPVPGTVLYNQVQRGEFELLDPFETLEEMKQIFENITADNMKFVGTHASNYMSVTGTLQRDKAKMIAAVDKVLKSRDKNLIRPDNLRGL
jgi:hypothetical protein